MCLTVGLCGPLWADAAKSHYKRGRKAERQGRLLEAYLHYQRARIEKPGNSVYAGSAERLRLSAAQTVAASGDLPAAAALDGAGSYLPEEPSFPLETRAPRIHSTFPSIDLLRPPVHLEPENKRAYFEFRGSVKEAYETVAEEFGLRAIFDGDFSGEETIRFELRHVSFRTALEALGDIGGGFVAPISEKLFLVAEDTTQKRQQLDPVAAVTVGLPEAMTPEQAQEISQAVQQTLELKRSLLSASRGRVAMRDSVAKIQMAQALYSQLARPAGEVMIEVELLAVNRDRTVDYGVSPPTSFPVTNFSTLFNAQAPELTADAAATMIRVGGGETMLGISVGGANLEAKMQRGEGRSLQRFQLRAVHGTQAELKIGERFPIINATFGPAVIDDAIRGEIEAGTLRPPIPSYTFEDLGLVLTVTPTVHSAREVSLEIEVEFKLLAGGSVNGVPILANRAFSSQLRLVEGEYALVSGMAVMEERKNRSGLAWLGKIPLLGRFFRKRTRQFNQSDLVLSIRPRIVRLPPAELGPSLTFRFGPEQRPLPAL